MLSLIIWHGCILLEAWILFRGFRARILAKYPFFYVQLLIGFAVSLSFYAATVLDPASYDRWYWASQLLTMFTACGIILEILRHSLSQHSSLKAFARTVHAVLFAVVFGFATVYLTISAIRRVETSNILFERDFRAFQAILLLAILGGIFFYGVPIGRNLKGIFLGYGLYVAASLMILSLRLYEGPAFDSRWYFLQPLSYTISVAIWTFSLWSYHPNPVPWAGIEAAPHDESFVARTRLMMGAMRSYLAKAARA
jgi:hypothetical protein